MKISRIHLLGPSVGLCSFVVLLAHVGCGSSGSAGPGDDAERDAQRPGQESADADGVTLVEAGSDSAYDSTTPDANLSCVPWTMQIGAVSSFTSAQAVTTDPSGNVVVTGTIAGNLPFSAITDVTKYTQRPFVLLGKYDNAGTNQFAIGASEREENGYGNETDVAPRCRAEMEPMVSYAGGIRGSLMTECSTPPRVTDAAVHACCASA